jgi:hypothetical protein
VSVSGTHIQLGPPISQTTLQAHDSRLAFLEQGDRRRTSGDLVLPDRVLLDPSSEDVVHKLDGRIGLDGSCRSVRSRDLVSTVKQGGPGKVNGHRSVDGIAGV